MGVRRSLNGVGGNGDGDGTGMGHQRQSHGSSSRSTYRRSNNNNNNNSDPTRTTSTSNGNFYDAASAEATTMSSSVRRVVAVGDVSSSSSSNSSSNRNDTQHKNKRNFKYRKTYRKNVMLSSIVLLGIISVSRILWGSFATRKHFSTYWQNQHQHQHQQQQHLTGGDPHQRRRQRGKTQHHHQLLRPTTRRSSSSTNLSSPSKSSSPTIIDIQEDTFNVKDHNHDNKNNRHESFQSTSNDRIGVGEDQGQHQEDVQFQASERRKITTTTTTNRRRDSSRPRIIQNDDETSENTVDLSSFVVESSAVYPTLNDIVTTTTTTDPTLEQQQPVKEEEYTSESKIMISGLLVHPVATELAINITQRFQIPNIVGMSKIPTTVSQSLRLEFVMRKIPDLQINLTKYYPPTEQQIHDIIQSFQPTHIFHFVVEELGLDVDRDVDHDHGDDDGGESKFHDGSSSSQSQLPPPPFLPSIHDTQRDLSILNGLCKSLVKVESKTVKKPTTTTPEQSSSTTKLIVVTLNVPPTDNTLPSSFADPKYHASSTTRQTLHSTLLQTYRLHYHLNIRQINLPHIFGPFDNDDNIIKRGRKSSYDDDGGHDDSDPVAKLINTIVPSTSSFADNSNVWLHVADAVDKITSSGGLQHDRITSLPVLSVKDSDAVTRNQLAVSLLKSLTMNNTTTGIATTFATTATAIQQVYLNAMISWFVMKNNPYGLNNASYESSSANNLDDLTSRARFETTSILSTHNMSDIVSLDERRRHGLFPCLSECASTMSDCTEESVWTVDSISASRVATDGCRYLLYMVDFSRDLKKIQVMKESPDAPSWPKNLFCQVAFVSKRSPIVLKAIKTWFANITDHDGIDLDVDQAYREQNGLLSSDGWRLVWIDQDEDLLSEADLLLPKLAPGGLVSSNVTKAFYVELEHLQTIPPLQVVWFLMARKLDTKAMPAKRVRETRSGTTIGRFIDASPVPARHVALFAHKFFVPPEIATINDDKLISFILKQKGRNDSRSKRAAFRRQWEAYGHSLHFWEERIDPTLFRVVDTALIIHQIGSSQSRRLRCEWYEEHLFWNDRATNSNRYLEDLSLSYVLSRRRQRGWLEYFDDDWGDKMLDDNILPLSSNSTTTNLHDYFVSLHNPIKARKEY